MALQGGLPGRRRPGSRLAGPVPLETEAHFLSAINLTFVSSISILEIYIIIGRFINSRQFGGKGGSASGGIAGSGSEALFQF
jgi:hypothetical protein